MPAMAPMFAVFAVFATYVVPVLPTMGGGNAVTVLVISRAVVASPHRAGSGVRLIGAVHAGDPSDTSLYTP